MVLEMAGHIAKAYWDSDHVATQEIELMWKRRKSVAVLSLLIRTVLPIVDVASDYAVLRGWVTSVDARKYAIYGSSIMVGTGLLQASYLLYVNNARVGRIRPAEDYEGDNRAQLGSCFTFIVGIVNLGTLYEALYTAREIVFGKLSPLLYFKPAKRIEERQTAFIGLKMIEMFFEATFQLSLQTYTIAWGVLKHKSSVPVVVAFSVAISTLSLGWGAASTFLSRDNFKVKAAATVFFSGSCLARIFALVFLFVEHPNHAVFCVLAACYARMLTLSSASREWYSSKIRDCFAHFWKKVVAEGRSSWCVNMLVFFLCTFLSCAILVLVVFGAVFVALFPLFVLPLPPSAYPHLQAESSALGLFIKKSTWRERLGSAADLWNLFLHLTETLAATVALVRLRPSNDRPNVTLDHLGLVVVIPAALAVVAYVVVTAASLGVFIRDPGARRKFEFVEKVRNDGLRLRDAEPAIRADAGVAAVAARENGLALEFVAEPLKHKKPLVLLAVQNAGTALRFAGDDLRQDEEVALQAVQDDVAALRYTQFAGDQKFIGKLVGKQRGLVLEFVDDSLKRDMNLVCAGVEVYGEALRFLPDELRNAETVIRAAVNGGSGNWRALKYAGDKVKQNPDFILDDLEEKARSDCCFVVAAKRPIVGAALVKADFKITERWSKYVEYPQEKKDGSRSDTKIYPAPLCT